MVSARFEDFAWMMTMMMDHMCWKRVNMTGLPKAIEKNGDMNDHFDAKAL